MTETSPSSLSEGSSAPPIVPSVELLGRAPIKRARPQLSCTPCRQGKLKCNREHPVCDQCAKRSKHDACHYVPPPPKNRQAQNMRGRIKNLESLVVNLINQKAQEQESTGNGPQIPTHSSRAAGEVIRGASIEPDAETFGQLHISNSGNETRYVGAGHWSSLLKEIEEVKDSLESDDEDESPEEVWDHANARSTVTFGVPRPITKAQLIQEMPPKAEVDRLLPLWFNSADPLLYIIHAPTFQEEYKQFWNDPNSMPVMWIALLYSAMALGIILGPRNPGMNAQVTAHSDASDSPYGKSDYLGNSVNKFQQLASSALVLADIAKSQPYTLESLMIYGECEFLRRDDNHSKIWLMNGVTLRVAMRMGYHRDPSNFKGISPFHGEMRRRVWHVLNMMDTLVSFAIGLPTLLRRVESDARAPHNYIDSDISPSMNELPRERPATEITPATYTIAKSRVCVVFAEAAELSQRVIPPKHSTIMELDRRLEEAHDLIPEGMRVRPMEDCITEQPVLIMSRFNIEVLYQKTRLVLHRNYLTAGQTDARFAESRKICVNAALKLLNYHDIIFHACQPGGQLNKVWWYMSSLQAYDFLLGAMILCLELNHLRTAGDTSPRTQELLGVLENTYSIWANHPNRYRESVRGAEILKTMLKKCSAPVASEPNVQDTAQNGYQNSMARPLPKEVNGNTSPDIGNLPPTGLTPNPMPEGLPPQIWGSWAQPDAPSLEMPDIPSEIDWVRCFTRTSFARANVA
ncbi:hypothetical protein BS50DRAFT_488478 [Corynespora cassiicola Philippines]|uniref:Zn(2)-C6 fungal-type domain-containing protein n=1 Tax=Corynespora cassiicola Philippines TaxID=1448308 RepID=A0A2T2NY65_CORCC|nr:hypothetical protein BS50DRAFT_488478 [Corynespora cassiicola Philippines]